MANTLPISILHEKLSYDFSTGEIRWKNTTQWTKSGEKAGCNSRGYIVISVNKKMIFAHRIAWAMYYGEWPTLEIDHINNIRSDNRICNLRIATHNENCLNLVKPRHNKSGLKGVSWHAGGQKWQAHIKAFGKKHYLGLFLTKEEAHKAYCDAAKKLHGEFANFGRK